MASSDQSSPDTWTEDDNQCAQFHSRTLPSSIYHRGTVLGSGGWCIAYKVKQSVTGDMYAGKAPRELDAAGECIRCLRREHNILQSIHHDHILKLVDFYEDPENSMGTMLITELCPYGSLQSMIDRTSSGLSWPSVLTVLCQMGSALAYLHSRSLFHTDVKPLNMLVRSHQPLHLVLGDCADVKPCSACEGCAGEEEPHGTKQYYSPFTAEANKLGGPSDDVWALGVTMLGMMGQWPQPDMADEDWASEYPWECGKHAADLVRMNSDNEAVVKLLGGMLEMRKEVRIAAEEVVRLAGKMAEGNGGSEEVMKIAVPDEFQRIEFW